MKVVTVNAEINVVIEGSEEGGYFISCPSMPGCLSDANTIEDAMSNIEDAIRLYNRASTKAYIDSLESEK